MSDPYDHRSRAGFLGLASGALGINIPDPDMVGPLVAGHVLGPIGAVQVGGQSIQTSLGISPAVATILQSLILFGAIGAAVFSTYQLRLVDRKVAVA